MQVVGNDELLKRRRVLLVARGKSGTALAVISYYLRDPVEAERSVLIIPYNRKSLPLIECAQNTGYNFAVAVPCGLEAVRLPENLPCAFSFFPPHEKATSKTVAKTAEALVKMSGLVVLVSSDKEVEVRWLINHTRSNDCKLYVALGSNGKCELRKNLKKIAVAERIPFVRYYIPKIEGCVYGKKAG